MRITKKMLREAKSGMRRRITELAALGATGGLREEWERCFPGMKCATGSDWEIMRSLLFDLLDLAMPIHWHD